MFHVSYQGQTYKNWLYEALSYLYMETYITPENYKDTLKKLARIRFLDYLPNKKNTTEKELNNILDNGIGVSHFIFNYLDYLLWENDCFEKYLGDDKKFIDEAKIKQKIIYFKFAFRNSIEHYYSQNPNTIEKMDERVNNFGNLCLITQSSNSKLSNASPDEKKRNGRNGNLVK